MVDMDFSKTLEKKKAGLIVYPLVVELKHNGGTD